MEDFEIWITTPEDLLLQKLMWHRGKDLEDIKGILSRQEKLDWKYIQKWAKKLELEDKILRLRRDQKT